MVKTNIGLLFVGTFLTVFLAIILGSYYLQIGPGQPGSPAQPPTTGVAECQETPNTDVTIDYFNSLNQSEAENMSARRGYLYEQSSPLVFLSSVSSASAKTVNCGKDYVVKFVGHDQTTPGFGVTTKLVDLECTNCELTSDGNLKFHTAEDVKYIQVYGKMKAWIETRVFDVDNDEYCYLGPWANSAVYWNGTNKLNTTTGITWEVGNTTCNGDGCSAGATGLGGLEVDAGREMNYRIEIRANSTDADINDRGVVILVDASTAYWNEPSVGFDGVTMSEASDQLTNAERRAYADYEWAYVVDKPVLDTTHQINFKIKALSGVNPTTGYSPIIAVAVRGNFLSIDGKTVKVGSVNDKASPSQVYSMVRYNLTVS